MSGDIVFCQRCGHRLSQKKIEDRVRPYCTECGFVVFLDPKMAVVVLVSVDGKLVMVRRGVEPALGRWSFPSGYVDRGEVVEDAATREVREETGLQIELDGFIGLYSSRDAPVILAAYSASVTGSTLRSGGEVQEVALFSPEELPPLPFPNDAQILAEWRARGSGQE